jgi:hypothetical protein
MHSKKSNRFPIDSTASSEKAGGKLMMAEKNPWPRRTGHPWWMLWKRMLPGVDKEKVKLSVEDGVLTISGRREPEKEEPGMRLHRMERAYGSFARSFAVPDTVDQQKVTAEFKNGLLTVRLPKSEKARPKSITVTVR